MIKTGGIDILDQNELKALPQHAASAWSIMGNIVGANYKALVYVGTQIVKGVNHVFIAQQNFLTAQSNRHIVLVKINEFDGEFSVVSIETIV